MLPCLLDLLYIELHQFVTLGAAILQGFGELVVLLSTSARVEQLVQAISCSSELTSSPDNCFLKRCCNLPIFQSLFLCLRSLSEAEQSALV